MDELIKAKFRAGQALAALQVRDVSCRNFKQCFNITNANILKLIYSKVIKKLRLRSKI